MRKHLLAVALVLMCAATAAPQLFAQTKQYKTRNVIVAVMDGVRYSETFGYPERATIPNLAALAKEGTLCTNFRIAGPGVSITRQGHSTLSTGTWQTVALSGARMTMPTFFEYARNELSWKETDCYAIFGKGPYSYARYSSFPSYGDKFKPSFVIGLGEKENANDQAVLDRLFQAIDTDKPRLIFANFGVTDHIAHVSTWENHLDSIRNCDAMFGKLWKKIQSTPGYKDETTVIFVNDHGRHDSKTAMDHNGFKAHGDQCEGCRHIMFLAVGPDIKKGATIEREVQQIDVCPTVGELLGFQTPLSDGKVISDCLVAPLGINTKATKTAEAREGAKLKAQSQKDLINLIADANLQRKGELAPSYETETLMRGMQKAAALKNEPKYRAFVQNWVNKNLGTPDNQYVASVALGQIESGKASEADAAKMKDYVFKAADAAAKAPSPADEQAKALRASFLARAGAVLGNNRYKDAANRIMGFDTATEQQLVVDWRKLNVTVTPMACDVPAAIKDPTSRADAVKLYALVDAASAMPRQRIVRLACLLQECACSRGRSELGANWKDPVQSALTLASVVNVNQLKPNINWGAGQSAAGTAAPVRPAAARRAAAAAAAANPAGTAAPARPAAARRAQQAAVGRWTAPMNFYKDSVPWQILQLKFKVSETGHFADGDPVSDGAALILFCDTYGKPLSGGKIVSQAS